MWLRNISPGESMPPTLHLKTMPWLSEEKASVESNTAVGVPQMSKLTVAQNSEGTHIVEVRDMSTRHSMGTHIQ